MKIIESSGSCELEFLSEEKVIFEDGLKPKKQFDISCFVHINETDELLVELELVSKRTNGTNEVLSITFPDCLTTSALPLTPVNVASFVDRTTLLENTFCRIIAALLVSEASLTMGLHDNEVYFLFQIRDFATETRLKITEIENLLSWEDVEPDNVNLETEEGRL